MDATHPNYRDIDKAKIRLYNHFYASNTELFLKHPSEYWFFCRKYIERGIQDWKYYQKELPKELPQPKKQNGLEKKV